MKRKLSVQLASTSVLAMAMITNLSGQSEYDALKSLERKHGGTARWTQSLQFAPRGHIIVDAPRRNYKTIKRIDAPGTVNVAVVLRNNAGTFYISDWSWNRYLKGIKPNWVIIPGGSPADSNASAFWKMTYDQLKHDNRKHNCYAAYGYLFENRKDPAVVKLCKARYPSEKDLQARSAAIAILCQSPLFKHDKTFCRDVFEQLIAYRRAKTAFWFKGDYIDPPPGWIENWIYSYNWGLGSAWCSFVVRNGAKYQRIVSDYLDSEDMLVKWLATHTLARHDHLAKYTSAFDDKFFSVVFSELRNDREKYNAVYATRTLMILRPISDPYVDTRMRRRLDDQERTILSLFQRDLTRPENRKVFELHYGTIPTNLFGRRDQSDTFRYELLPFSNLKAYDP